jgi:hypothetical protein
MIDLARSRVGTAPELIAADVFDFEPTTRFDCAFFGFWLSHVPPGRFAAFWQLLSDWLLPQGRALFVDEGAPRGSGEVRSDPSGHLSERRLRDGSVHRIVKVFHQPAELERKLADLGWAAKVRLTDGGFLVGVARR